MPEESSPAVVPESTDTNRSTSLLLAEDIRTAWKYATRSVNWCESANLPDTRQAMAEIVVKLSQQLEFVETELQAERIAQRRVDRERRESYDQETTHGH